MKTFVENREGKSLCVVVDISQNNNGLAVIMHGLGGNKNQEFLQLLKSTWLSKGFSVLTFDTSNTIGGESEGYFEDATLTNYYNDLEDVISWASMQEWYSDPLHLTGHSLGGICTVLYALEYPKICKSLTLISSVISGELSFETYTDEEIEEWKQYGKKAHKSINKELKWKHMEDRLQYDILPKVKYLDINVLIIVGDEDTLTPLSHQKYLYNALKCEKQLKVIQGAKHSFSDNSHQIEMNSIVSNWIEKIHD